MADFHRRVDGAAEGEEVDELRRWQESLHGGILAIRSSECKDEEVVK